MEFQNPDDAKIYKILSETKTIAVVGASNKPDKISHAIMKNLQRWGYRCIPVNPNEDEVLGEKCCPDLLSVAERIDIVNVFRRPEHTPSVAEQAVKIGAKVLWLQQGVANDRAATTARAGGLAVIMDYCIAVAHSTFHVPFKK